MQLIPIHTGLFKLDGGAMFGVVPKTLWQRINPPDNKNLCTWALRCLFVETGEHRILIDCGLGNKQSEKFFGFYEPHGGQSLDKSLNNIGITKDDITDVFLTHLHFDHCGGAIKMNTDGHLEPAFKNARYWSHEKHWQWAVNPNPRERASFLKENIMPLKESGQLHFVTPGENPFPGIEVLETYGHTEAQMIPRISYKGHTIVFMADLLPSAGHLPLPYVMAYDVRPLITLKEKEAFLEEALANNYILYFEHDRENECCTVKMTEKGIRPDQFFKLSEL